MEAHAFKERSLQLGIFIFESSLVLHWLLLAHCDFAGCSLHWPVRSCHGCTDDCCRTGFIAVSQVFLIKRFWLAYVHHSAAEFFDLVFNSRWLSGSSTCLVSSTDPDSFNGHWL